jgi:pimeloyl-ACP methyl ester carboxylesterase
MAGLSQSQSLIAVEGHRRLNLYCTGQGGPTVLFDAGGSGSTAVWRFVQGEVAKVTRACAYDRAGFGFSDPPSGRSDADAAVTDIHRLLVAAKFKTPIVYVGHSLAGLFGVLLVAKYPNDVAAEVLVDPSFADQDYANLATLPANKRKDWLQPDYEYVAQMKKCAAMRGALPKVCLGSQSDPRPQETELAALDQKQVSQKSYILAGISEYEAFLPHHGVKSVDQQQIENAKPDFGKKPLFILTRSGAPGYWRAGHDRLALLSKKGSNVIVPNSTHSMINEKPKPVIDAVLKMVALLRHH